MSAVQLNQIFNIIERIIKQLDSDEYEFNVLNFKVGVLKAFCNDYLTEAQRSRIILYEVNQE